MIEEMQAGAAVTANFAMFETLDGEQTQCVAAGRYRDILVRESDGRLLFREKVSIADSAIVHNSLVFPF